jgi:hypothetical protein
VYSRTDAHTHNTRAGVETTVFEAIQQGDNTFLPVMQARRRTASHGTKGLCTRAHGPRRKLHDATRAMPREMQRAARSRTAFAAES